MKQAKVLGIFALTMLTVTAIDSVRNLPAAALFGSPLIFYYLLTGLFFLIPSALVSAELAATWPQDVGIYAWVKRAFGKKTGMLAIWFQWLENIFWYPTILSFIVGTALYLINPAWVHNKYIMYGAILTVFWLLTALNLFGVKASARLTSFCGIAGLIIPMLFIIGLGAAWFAQGHVIQIHLSLASIIPNVHHYQHFNALSALVLSCVGMELSASYILNAKNPQRDYPLALGAAAVITLFTLIFGSLAIAFVVPNKDLSLVTGLMQAFYQFLAAYHLTLLTPLLAILIVFGTIGTLNNWIMGPNKCFTIALQEFNVAKKTMQTNEQGTPVALLLIQALIVTVMASAFVFMPTLNAAYWVLTVMTSQLYMLMYVLLFLTGIKLRKSYPEQPRPFAVPWKKYGMTLVSGAGIVLSLIVIGVGFIPPTNMGINSTWHFDMLLLLTMIVSCALPFVFFAYKKSAILSLQTQGT